jgi:hypothetical protein
MEAASAQRKRSLIRDNEWTTPFNGVGGAIRGMRAKASCNSHDDLNAATALKRGDPADLGALHRRLRQSLPRLKVMGGCCGADHTPFAAIPQARR